MEDEQEIFHDWFHSPLGHAVVHAEQEVLSHAIKNKFGYHLLQIGLPQLSYRLDQSPIKHQILYSIDVKEFGANIYGESSLLPFANNSIDLVVLPHTLEFIDDSKALLDEVIRILIPNGHVVIMGFNPFSLWGLRKWFRPKNTYPWKLQFNSVSKLSHYLSERACQIESVNGFFYRPPFSSLRRLRQFLFFEAIGKILWPMPSGLYLITARKMVARLTPLKSKWQLSQLFKGKTAVQPTVSSSRDYNISKRT